MRYTLLLNHKPVKVNTKEHYPQQTNPKSSPKSKHKPINKQVNNKLAKQTKAIIPIKQSNNNIPVSKTTKNQSAINHQSQITRHQIEPQNQNKTT